MPALILGDVAPVTHPPHTGEFLPKVKPGTKRGTTLGFHGCYIYIPPLVHHSMVMSGKMCLDGSEEFSQIKKFGLSMEKRCPRTLFLSLA